VAFLVRKVAFESTVGFLKDRTVDFSVLQMWCSIWLRSPNRAKERRRVPLQSSAFFSHQPCIQWRPCFRGFRYSANFIPPGYPAAGFEPMGGLQQAVQAEWRKNETEFQQFGQSVCQRVTSLETQRKSLLTEIKN